MPGGRPSQPEAQSKKTETSRTTAASRMQIDQLGGICYPLANKISLWHTSHAKCSTVGSRRI
jgi:hypothetical protein